MTTRDTHPSGEDLAYLTAIARSGEDAPLLGGRFLVWWAGLTSLVILAHWSAMMGYGPLGAGAVWPLWIGYIVIGSAGQAALVWSIRHKPGQGAPANRTEAAVWMSAGLGIWRDLSGRHRRGAGRAAGAGVLQRAAAGWRWRPTGRRG